MKDLIGREISGVAFIRDHVEFHFDGPVVHCLADPSVAVAEALYRFPKPGSRDALCLVIGSTVQSLYAVEGGHVEFKTSNGCRVRAAMKRR